MKLWSGRFKREIDKKADAFNSSLPFDKRLYKHDIMGSIAHCTMLGECEIIPKPEAELICKTLSQIFFDINSGKLQMGGAEDIHTFVEQELTSRIGEIGKKLHTGRSRNDQIALDMRLYMRDTVTALALGLKGLIDNVITISEQHLTDPMPAFTHMQIAQPTTLAHYLMAYAEMFMRDIERLNDCKVRINIMPLGSGACTGTSFPINRKRVAELLDFPDVTHNSLDGVSDRDFVIEFISVCSEIMIHLSRLSEELIYFSSAEFGYVTLDDRFSTGSSIMPQKKNPDMCELIRGKCGRVFGHLMSILTVMKGLPLAYNKDMQEDKEAVFDTEDTVKDCIAIMSDMLPTFKFDLQKLRKDATAGYSCATECADYLVSKGLPFRDAHSAVGKLVIYASENGMDLDKIPLEKFKEFSPLFDADIYKTLDLNNIVNKRSMDGGPSQKAVKKEISVLNKKLAKYFSINE